MKWPFGKEGVVSEGEGVDVDGYMKELTMGSGKLPEEENFTFLKSVRIASETDLERVEKELRKGNIVVMNISGLFSDRGKLRSVIGRVKDMVKDLNGDLCKVSNEKILLVPVGMEIVA
jgi:SepF-like predicted cell division protein (DUF552 family)